MSIMARPVVFVIILTQFLFVLPTSAQISGKVCCVESWKQYVQPVVDFLKKNPVDLDLNNPEFQKVYKVWNDSFDNYYRSAPDDICNGLLLYKCKSDEKCVCNDNKEDGIAVLNGNGVCVVASKGGFCDNSKFHRCKTGFVCSKNPKYGGNFSHCAMPGEDEDTEESKSKNGNASSYENSYGTGFFVLISLLTMCQKIIFK